MLGIQEFTEEEGDVLTEKFQEKGGGEEELMQTDHSMNRKTGRA